MIPCRSFYPKGDNRVFLGGTLIRNFDGFRRLFRRAAAEFNHPFTISDDDMRLINRTLAGLGGPPANREVVGPFNSDGLATLLLFLLTQELECRVGLLGHVEPTMVRLKSLVHVLSQAAYPLITGLPALPFAEAIKEMGPERTILKPLVIYDEAGEPTSIALSGAHGRLGVGLDHGPYTLAILVGQHAGPAPLERANSAMQPSVLIVPD
jgi:hypothetical protein